MTTNIRNFLHYCRTGLLAFVFLISCFTSQPTLAQDSSVALIEGHVFNAKTGLPLKNVTVVITQTKTDGSQTEVIAITDVGGFYTAAFVPEANVISNQIAGRCRTRKTTTTSTQPLYYPLRTTNFYTRDFYIPIPDNQGGCRL